MHLQHEPTRSRRLPRPLLLERLEERCLLSYSITDLGTLPQAVNSDASGINASGQVVGSSAFSEGHRAFLWDSTNGMQDLGTFPGGVYADADGINDAGQVVGRSGFYGGTFHAFLWDSSNGMQDLGTLGGPSEAQGINYAGQVVGYSYPPDGFYHAFLWDTSNGMQDLGTLPGGLRSEAYAINASGQVVGFSTDPTHAFLWDSSNGMQDLGTPAGGNGSGAFGIKVSGQVVGTWYLVAGGQQAFLWDSTNGMQDLGTLPGLTRAYAWGINDVGQVVGEAADQQLETRHAFLWDSANGMQDLNALIPPDSGWTLQSAAAITDAGQIVGNGINPAGQGHAYLLTPDGGGAPRGRTKSPAGIDPAVIQVLASFASHDTPGFSGSIALFQNTQAGPVSPETVKPFEVGPTRPTGAGLFLRLVSTERQVRDVLFTAGGLTQTADQWSGWELDLLALELSQPG